MKDPLFVFEDIIVPDDIVDEIMGDDEIVDNQDNGPDPAKPKRPWDSGQKENIWRSTDPKDIWVAEEPEEEKEPWTVDDPDRPDDITTDDRNFGDII